MRTRIFDDAAKSKRARCAEAASLRVDHELPSVHVSRHPGERRLLRDRSRCGGGERRSISRGSKPSSPPPFSVGKDRRVPGRVRGRHAGAGPSPQRNSTSGTRSCDKAKGTLLTPEDLLDTVGPDEPGAYRRYVQSVAALWGAYEEELYRRNLIDFSDMIRIVVRGLADNTRLRERYVREVRSHSRRRVPGHERGAERAVAAALGGRFRPRHRRGRRQTVDLSVARRARPESSRVRRCRDISFASITVRRRGFSISPIISSSPIRTSPRAPMTSG